MRVLHGARAFHYILAEGLGIERADDDDDDDEAES